MLYSWPIWPQVFKPQSDIAVTIENTDQHITEKRPLLPLPCNPQHNTQKDEKGGVQKKEIINVTRLIQGVIRAGLCIPKQEVKVEGVHRGSHPDVSGYLFVWRNVYRV